MNWPEHRLGRIARLRVSNVDKLSRDGEIPVRLCNYVDVYKNDAITGDLDFMHATATSAQVTSFRLTVGDTIFTKDSETADDIGVPAYVAEAGNDLVCGYHLAIATPDPTAVDPRFLFWAMSSGRVRDQWTVLAAGVTRVGLRSDDLGKAGIPVPPLDEQRRIADFLDTETARLDAATGLRDRQIAAARERVGALLDETQEDLAGRYGRTRLKHLARSIRQGWSPQCEDRVPDGDEWSVLKAGAVNGGRFHPSERKTLPTELEPRVEYEVRAGDLLVNRASGSLNLIGSAAVVPDSVPPRTLLCDKIYRIALDPRRVPDARWVAFMLKAPAVRSLLLLGVSGAEGMANSLPAGWLTSLQLPDVPPDVQQQTVSALADSHFSLEALASSAVRMRSLVVERRHALITAAVTGQLDVTTARGGHS